MDGRNGRLDVCFSSSLCSPERTGPLLGLSVAVHGLYVIEIPICGADRRRRGDGSAMNVGCEL